MHRRHHHPARGDSAGGRRRGWSAIAQRRSPGSRPAARRTQCVSLGGTRCYAPQRALDHEPPRCVGRTRYDFNGLCGDRGPSGARAPAIAAGKRIHIEKPTAHGGGGDGHPRRRRPMRRNVQSTGSLTQPVSHQALCRAPCRRIALRDGNRAWHAVSRDRKDRRGTGRGKVALRSVQGIEWAKLSVWGGHLDRLWSVQIHMWLATPRSCSCVNSPRGCIHWVRSGCIAGEPGVARPNPLRA